jgi:hypothetical protein
MGEWSYKAHILDLEEYYLLGYKLARNIRP